MLQVSNIAGDGGHMASPCDSPATQRCMPRLKFEGNEGRDYWDAGFSRCTTDDRSKSRGRNTQGSDAARPRGTCRDEDHRVEPW